MPDVYTVKDRWGYWWSSVVSPEEGYVCHGETWSATTLELRTLDYIVDGYGGIDDDPSLIEDDEIITSWADDVIRVAKARPKPKPTLQTIERGEDPSLLDPDLELEVTLDLIFSERKRSEQLRHLRLFAEKVWDVAYDTSWSDGPDILTPSPFKRETRASDG